MVKSDNLFNPQSYLELVTGRCYFQKSSEDVFTFIDNVLELNGLNLWNYPLSEIDHIVENDIDVVLVDCCYWQGDAIISELRWFEVPASESKDTKDNTTPCDHGDCPFGAQGGEDCRFYCGLGVDECGDDEYYDYEEEDEEYVPSAENGDYGPSNPWDAPGCSIKDFI